MILQDPQNPNQVLNALSELMADPTVSRLRLAVAYANPGGVDALTTLVSAAQPGIGVQVVLSLDMGITRKAALEALLAQYGDQVAVISDADQSATFHAKVFWIDRDGEPPRALIGSANLTDAALMRNREAAIISDPTSGEVAVWEAWWEALTSSAVPLTQDVVDAYRERRPRRGERQRIADEDSETTADGVTRILRPPSANADGADWLVIDWGGVGEYRMQAEFPSAAAAFFQPSAEEQRLVTIEFDGVTYTNNLLAYYANNGMTRINLDAEIPIVADGSIKDGAALFTRVEVDRYRLELLTASERVSRLAESDFAGTRDHTTRNDGSHREFGWG